MTKDKLNNTVTSKYPKRSRFGKCPLCLRELDLSFHHLIPKKMHRRTYFKKHYCKQTLAQGIDICRACHNALHRTYTEMELAKHFADIESIKKDERLSAHFAWVAKQKVQRRE